MFNLLIICSSLSLDTYTKPTQLARKDASSYRLNFDLDKKNEIHYHSWKEHLKMSKIAKFG
jgi:hypothetical protein